MFIKAWRIIKQVFVFLLILLAVFVGGWFASENPEPIAPLFFGIVFPALSIGQYLSAALVIGIILGWALSFFATQGKVLRVSREAKRKNKQIQKLEAQSQIVTSKHGDSDIPKAS